MAKKIIRFGVIGLGLMGREFGSAAARWSHLLAMDVQPVITGICDTNPALFGWFTDHFDSIKVQSADYHDLLASSEIDAIYCAVPHNLHAQVYIDIIRAGKHLLGEKPFGIDAAANAQIMAVLAEHPQVFVACSSEFPFFPGAQRIFKLLRDNPFGPIIEVEAGLLHSSDLNPDKPLNWKRMAAINGEYGCMGDLGMHPLHIPLRLGWQPRNVRALLSKLVTERVDKTGQRVPCDTWDNATLVGDVVSADYGQFPMTIKTYRIAPGETNTWYLHITGMRHSVWFSTRYPKSLYTLAYTPGGAQIRGEESLGYETAYPTITGGIFEFGLSDAILQMWAAFCDELAHGRDGMKQPFYCATPAETQQQHAILTAALASHRQTQVIPVAG
ncbi:MAG: Gfo/Idh/MocA family oxidoreductase [Anaerolineae bacterium]|nr:Gfo/Idh/MocA family oxidoreductase [Anaerolineae bacterium]